MGPAVHTDLSSPFWDSSVPPGFQVFQRHRQATLQRIYQTHLNIDDEYKAIVKYSKLSEGQTFQYYIIKPKLKRTLKIVMKGQPSDMKPEDNKEKLLEMDFNSDKVVQLTNR
ncbi:hypothetical protein NPIL_325321 [Nephila pilipes]|uniref:Uncharacterized protein n=1 Tax=Nephila pilipes TaxID=299642 RepID=A0A8X6MUK2_NEPPI|nr:hypothetical protein NPIL_325321 [Nephila pilipes]